MCDQAAESLISVIVPVYKTEKYVSNTIVSLKNQTYRNFEVIFVDDGSPDESVAIIEQEMAYSQLKYQIIHQKNQGQACARNTGFANLSGDWVLFLDSDDVLQNFTLEIYSNILKNNRDVDVIFSKHINVSDSNPFETTNYELKYSYIDQKEFAIGFLTRKHILLLPGTLFRVSFLKQNTILNPNIRWSEDQYFMWLVIINAKNIIMSQASLYNYYHHSGTSIMNSTSVDKMLYAFVTYQGLVEMIGNETVRKYLLPRWCLACLHNLAIRKELQEWYVFWKETNFSSLIKTLRSFPSFKVQFLALIGCINRDFLFWILSIH